MPSNPLIPPSGTPTQQQNPKSVFSSKETTPIDPTTLDTIRSNSGERSSTMINPNTPQANPAPNKKAPTVGAVKSLKKSNSCIKSLQENKTLKPDSSQLNSNGSTQLEAALALAEKGFKIFPCVPRGKEPLIKRWKRDATTDHKKIRNWFRKYPDANIGIVTSSKLFAVDVDGLQGATALNILEFKQGYFPNSWVTETGGGGNHYFFKAPTGDHITNSTGSLPPKIDIRGDGGYVIAPGSIHPNGNLYKWGVPPSDCPLAEAPPWLIAAIKAPKKKRDTPAEHQPKRVIQCSLALANQADEWLSKYTKEAQAGNRNEAGFQLSTQLRDTGLSQGEAHPYLLRFQSIVERRGNHPYTIEEALASLAQAYNSPPREPAYFRGTPNTINLFAEANEQPNPNEGHSPNTPLESPPLDENRLLDLDLFKRTKPVTFDFYESPDFPMESLDRVPWLSAFVKGISGTMQTPTALAGINSLAVVSACLMKHFQVTARPGWKENPNLFTLCVLPPSERKSQIMAACTEPLETIEREFREQHRKQSTATKTERDILERKQKKIFRKLEADTDQETEAALKVQLQEVNTQLDALPSLHSPQLITNDVTTEALVQLLMQNGERMALFAAEGKVLKNMQGLYSNGVASFDVFKSAYTGEAYNVNRAGREPQYLTNPLLTMALCIQPSVLSDTRNTPSMHGEGLLARFLFCIPNSKIGFRLTGDRVPVMPEKITSEYHKGIKSIYHNAQTSGTLHGLQVLKLTPEARELFNEFEADIELRKRDGNDFNEYDETPLAGWSGKLGGNTLRLALSLHAAEHLSTPQQPQGDLDQLQALPPIDRDTMQSAITLALFFIDHAFIAFQQLGVDHETQLGIRLLRWIQRTKRRRFIYRDGWHSTKSAFTIAGNYKKALDILTERGYLLQQGQTYHVHPEALKP
jgi:replicative DNA helicase